MLIVPPVGVLVICGFGGDFLVNIILTLLGCALLPLAQMRGLNFEFDRYFPGHIHAFYIIYVFYDRRSKARSGTLSGKRAPGIFSEDVQNGGTRGILRARDGFESEKMAPQEVKIE
jgi:uncharacterized membrane protein YqaE (UPF0057 family)